MKRRQPGRPPAAGNQPDTFANLSTDFSLPPAAVPRRPTASPTKRRSSGGRIGKLLMFGGGIGGVLLVFAAIGWFLFSSRRGATDDDAAADSTRVVSKPSSVGWLFGSSDSPEKVVDDYFEMLMASDEPREYYGAEKGTKEYEIRVKRYLTGDAQSRDLLRRALLVDGANDEELHQSFEERRHVIYEKYLFGIPAKSLQANEGKLRSDPRLADRRWKDLLKRYMAEVFFGLPNPKDVRSSQPFFDYVETLGAFARELSQIESESDAQDMETRFASMIDSIIEFAADSASETVRLVNETHSRAEYTYQRIIDAYMIELKSMGLDSEQFHNTLEDYTFAVQQVSRPLSRNGDRIRAELAERRAKRKPGYKPEQETKASGDKSRIAGKGDVNADSSSDTTEQDQATMGDRLRGGRNRRPGSRFGSSPDTVTDTGRGSDRRPSQRFGPPQPPKLSGTPDERKARSISRYDGPDRIQILIHGSRDTHRAVQEFMKKVGIDDFFYSRSGTTTTVYTKDARTAKELATEIDFGDVTAVDEARRVISVKWAEN